jgi:hypothetical protein
VFSVRTAYILWLPSLFGIAGLQRFYLGKVGTGLIYLFTGGLFGLGTIYDAFTLPEQVRTERLKRRYMDVLEREDEALLGGRAPGGGTAGDDRPMSLEHVILKSAKENHGTVSPGQIALEARVSTEKARAELERLSSKGFCEVRVRTSGALVYTFPEFVTEPSDGEFEQF